MDKNSVKAYMEYSEERFTKRVIYKKGETTAFVLNFSLFTGTGTSDSQAPRN
jgi:hypothetical protein